MQQVDDGLWIRGAPQSFMGMPIGSRMTAVRLPDGGLITRRFLDSLIEHRGQKIWFGALPNSRPVTRTEIYYGDGEPIEQEIVALTRVAQWKIAVAFSWQRGDVLCLDNIGCQHGRLSFSKDADRRVFVSMATPIPGVVRELACGSRA